MPNPDWVRWRAGDGGW